MHQFEPRIFRPVKPMKNSGLFIIMQAGIGNLRRKKSFTTIKHELCQIYIPLKASS